MNIVALKSADWPNKQVKVQIMQAIEDAAKDAERLLKHDAKNVNIVVQPNKFGSIPETGEGGRTFDSELIKVVFDPAMPFSVTELCINLRATVYHEYNHAVRYANTKYDVSILNHSITEGLATVFERDYSKTRAPLWGKYEDDHTMLSWLNEVQSTVFTSEKFDEFTYLHPDGRRWIAYKLGTWIADKAIKNSGKTVQELTVLPWQEILRMAVN